MRNFKEEPPKQESSEKNAPKLKELGQNDVENMGYSFKKTEESIVMGDKEFPREVAGHTTKVVELEGKPQVIVDVPYCCPNCCEKGEIQDGHFLCKETPEELINSNEVESCLIDNKWYCRVYSKDHMEFLKNKEEK